MVVLVHLDRILHCECREQGSIPEATQIPFRRLKDRPIGYEPLNARSNRAGKTIS